MAADFRHTSFDRLRRRRCRFLEITRSQTRRKHLSSRASCTRFEWAPVCWVGRCGASRSSFSIYLDHRSRRQHSSAKTTWQAGLSIYRTQSPLLEQVSWRRLPRREAGCRSQTVGPGRVLDLLRQRIFHSFAIGFTERISRRPQEAADFSGKSPPQGRLARWKAHHSLLGRILAKRRAAALWRIVYGHHLRWRDR
jgi:hypothetical protein